jgi:hypothetical protein
MKSFKYLLFISLILFSCSDTPIFYTLEKAYRTADDRGLEDTAVVEKIVYADTLAPVDNYFLLAQSVFQRAEGTTANWQSVTPPVSKALCGALEYFSVTGEIIAWFYDTDDGSSLGLYKRDPAASPSVPSSWTKINDANVSVSGVRVNFLKEVNGNILVSTSVYSSGTYTHNLYYSTDASDSSFAACFGTDLNEMVLDIAYDPADTDYWVITIPGDSGLDQPRYLYQDTDGDPLPQNFSDVSAAGPAFWKNGSNDPVPGTLYTPSSLYYAAGNLYLSGRHGRIFVRPSAGSWSTWTDPRMTVEVKNDDFTVMFTGLVETGQPNEIFVGSTQYGYYYFSSALTALSASDLNTATASGLYEYFPNELDKGAIQNFLATTEDPGNLMFICTSGAGLWRGDWDGSKWVWRQE